MTRPRARTAPGRGGGLDPPDRAAQHLIESYLADVGARLSGPARAREAIADELRAGLLDATDGRRSSGLPAAEAAASAIVEFGHPRQVANAFRPGLASIQARRLALCLLATGPLVGLLWASAAVASHVGARPAPPWQWAGAPHGAPVAFPLAAAAAFASLTRIILASRAARRCLAARAALPGRSRSARLTTAAAKAEVPAPAVRVR